MTNKIKTTVPVSSVGADGKQPDIKNINEILLKQYLGTRGQTSEEEKIQIGMISRAAFFCDIGNMLLPNNFKFKASKQDEMSNDIYGHTRSGASIVRLNYSKHCEYFVQVCADIKEKSSCILEEFRLL